MLAALILSGPLGTQSEAVTGSPNDNTEVPDIQTNPVGPVVTAPAGGDITQAPSGVDPNAPDPNVPDPNAMGPNAMPPPPGPPGPGGMNFQMGPPGPGGQQQNRGFGFQLAVQTALADMSLEEKVPLGTQIEDFILDCEYAGYPCNVR